MLLLSSAALALVRALAAKTGSAAAVLEALGGVCAQHLCATGPSLMEPALACSLAALQGIPPVRLTSELAWHQHL